MRVSEVAEGLKLRPLTPLRDRQVTGCYASDLLNDVMANGRDGIVWVTVQSHRYVAAVASLLDFAAVVLVNGREPEPELLDLARQEGVCLLSTCLGSYEIAGRLFVAGIRPAACDEGLPPLARAA